MKKRIIIVHGWEGSPTSDWIGWAREAFWEKGYEVVTPMMPDTNRPVIEKWVSHLKSVVGAVDENTYFIGYSIGCQTVMRFLETLDTKVGGAIFVVGWFNLTNQSEEEKEIAKPWIETSSVTPMKSTFAKKAADFYNKLSFLSKLPKKVGVMNPYQLPEVCGFFKKLYAVEHPRFIMQYRRKQLLQYIEKYQQIFSEALAQ